MPSNAVSGSRGEEVGRAISLGEGMTVAEELDRSRKLGGGCMFDEGVVVGTTGSGRAGIASSAEEVSKVMLTVGFEPCRSV